MNLKKISGAISTALILTSVLPAIALAQVGGGVQPPAPVITTYGGLIGIIKTATNWLFGILLVAAVIFLIYAAFLFLTSGGDEEKTKKARQYIIYAVIALAVGILAQAIVALVGNFLGYNVPTQ
jgi:threonine/homoserine/homoserine lactone efflux protein